MDSKIIIAIILVVILLCSIYGNYTTEHFGMFDALFNPGKWVGNQVGGLVNGVWKPLKQPIKFARDVYYNVAPNYTMVDRYLEKKNDWVRANKGIPLMKKINGNATFNFDDKRDDSTKRYAANIGTDSGAGAVGTSLMNKIF